MDIRDSVIYIDDELINTEFGQRFIGIAERLWEVVFENKKELALKGEVRCEVRRLYIRKLTEFKIVNFIR